jgi:hypothetical protein
MLGFTRNPYKRARRKAQAQLDAATDRGASALGRGTFDQTNYDDLCAAWYAYLGAVYGDERKALWDEDRKTNTANGEVRQFVRQHARFTRGHAARGLKPIDFRMFTEWQPQSTSSVGTR